MIKSIEEKDRVVVRFAGDSGDGMQLAGSRFTDATALLGNDLATLPDFPAEIRAPAGTLHGVSAFQIHFASRDILTPGDHPNVLVAMNPAALKTNIDALEAGGTVIVNEDAFSESNLRKAEYDSNPLDDDTLTDYQVFRVPMTSITVRATERIEGVTSRDAARSKNLFALGLVSWMYGRPTGVTVRWIEDKFASKPPVRDANLAAFRAGYNFGETAELLAVHYEVKPAPAEPGIYRNVNGTTAMALGLVVAGVRSSLPLFYASYPITPASELLHELSRHRRYGVRTMQAEDEIAAVNIALGASFGGHLGVTATSGPGMDLKQETIGLAVALELPLVVVDVQRAGPSTGMPTKTEAADLLMAMYGRHGESPLPIIAASRPGQCFDAALEAVRIAVTYKTPVILLSDTFLANSSEPWLIPSVADLPELDPGFATEPNDGDQFLPYLRDENLARPWAVPGTPGLQHRIGGLEKEDVTGNISYEAENHAEMTRIRAQRVAGIADDIPPLEVDADEGADVLVLGWGSSFGPIAGAARRLRREGHILAVAHLHHLNPLPRNTAEVVRSYRRVIVPEMNTGQLVKVIRSEFLVDAESITKVDGLPFFTEQLEREILARLYMTDSNVDRDNGVRNLPTLTKKDFASDQETRWCPGCGDYAILATVQGLMPELGIPPERTVFVTGIGCAGRLVYYMDTYGMHGIHGRATALATGVATARPDLSIWVVTGDGDALSIGGNHLIHALRRNVPIKILLFNNQIYGLTKGQYSPTSEMGKVTKSTPFGSQDHPFNPVALALGAEATFVARTVDTDRAHVADVLRAAAEHKGSSFVEIYQNCNVFNDGAFDAVRDKGRKAANQILLEHGQPIRFGEELERGVARDESGSLRIVDIADIGEWALVVHDAHREDPSLAFELAHLAERPTGPTPLGIFRDVERPAYGETVGRELAEAHERVGDDDLESLLHAGGTWTVE